jgi:Cu(I)/Ag(I) efflux system membrane fusion protein
MLLRPNMQIEAFVALPPREAALLVPHAAITDLGEQQRVVLDMGEARFKSVRVKLGERDSDYTEVLEGLQEGDVVVTSAHFLIDSESSRTSDFLRMEPAEEPEPEYPPTWVNATIKEIHSQERKLRLQHERVSAWKMPGMTMNFNVADGVSMRELKVNQRVRVRITDGNPLFQVLDIKPAVPGKSP